MPAILQKFKFVQGLCAGAGDDGERVDFLPQKLLDISLKYLLQVRSWS